MLWLTALSKVSVVFSIISLQYCWVMWLINALTDSVVQSLSSIQHCFTTVLLGHATNLLYRVSQKSSPPTTFNDIFAWAASFCITFCTFIRNLYPYMCTDFRLFILTCNEMALILSRSPIIFTVSSSDCSAGNKCAEFQLNGNDVIGQWNRFDCRLS